MAEPKAAPVEAVETVEPVVPVKDTSSALVSDAVPGTGTRFETSAPAVVPDGSMFTFQPKDGEPIKGVVTRVENRNILTTDSGETYDVRSDKGRPTVLTRVERVDGQFRDVLAAGGRKEHLVVPKENITMENPVNGKVEQVKFFSPHGVVVESGRPGPKGDTVLSLASGVPPKLSFEGLMPPRKAADVVLAANPVNLEAANPPVVIKGSTFPAEFRRELGLRRDALVTINDIPEKYRATASKFVYAGLDSGAIKVSESGAIVGTRKFSYANPDAMPVNPNPKGHQPAFMASPEFVNFKAANPDLAGRDLVKGYLFQQRSEYFAQHKSMEGFNQKVFGDNVPGWAQRRFGDGQDFHMRDPSKMPGFDIGGGDKMHRNMLEFWKGLQGMKPGDNLNGLLDQMNGRMNAKDIARLGDFLMGQLGRRGSDALGMQDILRLNTLFKGYGDRAGLNLQFGDNRSGLMMSFGLNGRFDLQIRFGALTLGFGDRGQTGLQQIGKLLFTQEGRLTQNALGTSGLRATDVLSRGFAGQGERGQWNPFSSATGDGALRASTQLTARLTAGNRDFISQLRDNSAKLSQQLEASKMAQMSKMPGMVPGDFKPTQQLDPGAKNLIQQNFDPLRQDVGKLQPGQRADGPRILTGNIEMDARAADGMGGRRGPLTAAAHEATMKGDLQNQQAKVDQLPGAKLPGEKLSPEEEANKRKLEEEKKKGDIRAGEQFLQEEEERKAKERREQEELDREEELEALNETDEAKRRALLLILEARRKREKELKEKALKDQIKKQEEAKRAQYRVAIGDSLENIATKQLRNPRLAGLIFDINKKVIPIKFMNGKEVAVLTVGAILSLPSVKEIKDFSQAGFTLGPKFNKVDFTVPAASQQGKSAEDELEAMFGSNWHGDEAATAAAQMETNQNGKSQEEMDDFAKRRANIESVLGKMGPTRAADGRMRYTVRLGDTLKSIAMKHPGLEDVSSWRVLAEINNLSTETDVNDNPKAVVPRGSVLMIPTRAEVEEHKRKMGLRKAIVGPGQTATTGSALPALKHCPNCGNKSIHTATICECGSEFVSEPSSSSPTGSHSAAPYVVGNEKPVVQEATNSFSGPPSKREDRFELALKSGHIDGDHWSEIANLEPETRIVKMNSVFDPNLEFSLLLLQALVDGRWLPVAGYEMRENAAIRIDYTDPRTRSSVKIDLPPSAAQDLAKNDLIKNWQNYKRKFVTVLPH